MTATSLAAKSFAIAATPPLLDVRNLKKYYTVGGGLLGGGKGIVRAVDDVSFTLRRGEVVALVGESGSGKTTVGQTVLRLREPTGGEILFDGTNIAGLRGSEMRDFRRRMQIIFQDPYASLNPRMTVGDLIGEGILVHKLAPPREIPDRVAVLLDKVGLRPEHMRRYIHEFSGGQRQRVGIARALAVNPTFIVADEPVSALDVSIQVQVMNLLKDLQEEMQLAMLMVTHDLGVVEYIADRVIVMYLGRVMEIAPARDLYRKPLHPYTESLISAVPIADPVRARAHRRTILKGDIPSPMNPPSGCVFRTRCPIATEDCAGTIPPLVEAEPGHLLACINR